MIEILPNWHPIFVHFTIALLTMAVIFYVLRLILPNRYQSALTLLAKTNLYIGVSFALITAVAGWFAYNSVNHDTASHLAMTEHRNIALITLAAFVVLALWSLLAKNKVGIVFTLLMVIAGGLLAATGWMGAEAVYRYGLGVMSLPTVSGEGHAHKHPDGQGHGNTSKSATQSKQSTENAPHPHTSSTAHTPTAKDTDMPMSTPATTHTEQNNPPHKATEEKATSKGNSHGDTPHEHAKKPVTPKASSHD